MPDIAMGRKCLVGKKEICGYARRSWLTVRRWIKENKFPAKKIDGIWESSTDLVDEWKEKRINGRY